MRREIMTGIDIAAPPERVWEVLLDFPAYREWNPFIQRLEGAAWAGGVLRVSMRLGGRRPMTFRPRILVVEAPRLLRWRGSLGIPGLFDGEHDFALAALPSGGTRFTHGERFSGLFVGFFGARMVGATKTAFAAMNEALRQRVEAREAPMDAAHDHV